MMMMMMMMVLNSCFCMMILMMLMLMMITVGDYPNGVLFDLMDKQKTEYFEGL